jgi:DNA-(apurinic or apyrimidinic site) lyase
MNGDPGTNQVRQEKLAAVLAQIPWEVWESILRKEPEWQNMAGFLPPYGFGPFATLIIAAGLNDYYLKGKAEIVYWPELRDRLRASPVPGSPSELLDVLAQFYQTERLSERKIVTLRTFLQSPLAERVWRETPATMAAEILLIRAELARAVEQPSEDKQILFAMKCLGLALLMAGEARFNFAPFPLPADSRLRKLTKRLKLAPDGQEAMRNLWQIVLTGIQKSHKQASMIHLDSLLWQIAPLREAELMSYFADLGIPETGSSLQAFLRE